MSNEGGFVGKIRNNWRQRATESTTFRAELRVVPRWLMKLLAVLYLAALGIVFGLSVSMPNLRPFGISVRPLAIELLAVFGAVTGVAIVVSAFVMLLGYVAGDAKRRDMSPILWVLVALFVPYLIGVLLYFVLREPLPFRCPQCGQVVSAQFNFCPACQFNLRPSCPQCRLAVNPAERFCPHCGFPLHSDAPATATPAEVRQ
jgi:RNA polymerase subunit RPABC4/transcription elongation factor Spt4